VEDLKLALALPLPDRFAELVSKRFVRRVLKDGVIPDGVRREGGAEDGRVLESDLAKGEE
jgi:hypothetical protein